MYFGVSIRQGSIVFKFLALKSEKLLLTRGFLKQHLSQKQNSYLQRGHLREVVAYKKWLL